MNQPKSIFATVFVFGVFLLTAAASFAQPKSEPSYQVSLQFVIGSNDAAPRSELPASFSAISRQLKANFAFSNYRLASTFLGRVSDSGAFAYKSVSNILGQETGGASPTFLEWSLNNFMRIPSEKGPAGFQAEAFVFGARVPVVSNSFRDESGKSSQVINYEQIGLTLRKIGLSENVPTLLGTLTLPGTTGTIFLVVTVKSADQ